MSETYEGGLAVDGLDDIARETNRLRKLVARMEAGGNVPPPPRRKRGSRREKAAKALTALEVRFPLQFQDALGRKRRMRPVAKAVSFGPAARRHLGYRPTGSYNVLEVMAIQRRVRKVRPHVAMATRMVGGRPLDVLAALDGVHDDIQAATELAVLDHLVTEARDSVTTIPSTLRTGGPKWDVSLKHELPTEQALAAYGPCLPVEDYNYGDGESLRRGKWSKDGTLLDAGIPKRGPAYDVFSGPAWTLETQANALLQAAGMDDPYEGLTIR